MRVRPHTPRTLVQAGFTLIELIIVIVIIGILAAIAIPKFLDLSSTAQDAALKSTAAELSAGASIAYAAVKGGAAASSTYTVTTGTACSGITWSNFVQGYSLPSTASMGGNAPTCTITNGALTYNFSIPTN